MCKKIIAGVVALTLVLTGIPFESFELNLSVLAAESSTVKNISDCTVNIPYESTTFTGADITPVVVVKDGENALEINKDYVVEYSNNVKVGNALITITGKGNYQGTITKTFTIVQKSLNYCTVSLSETSSVFNGAEIKPTVKVKSGDNTIYQGNYTVEYLNNIKAGTATVKLTGKNNLKGTITKTFEIVPKSLKYCDISLSQSAYGYTGEENKPDVTIKINGRKIYSSNYTVTYEDNINKGNAKVIITGKNNLQGTVEKTFIIGEPLSSSNIEDIMASVFEFNDRISEFEDNNNFEFSTHLEDITSDNYKFSKEKITDIKSFLEDYASEEEMASYSANSVDEIKARAQAKASAVNYSIDVAKKSVARNPKLDINDEAKYMFISHYIDRSDYYWTDADKRHLLDGPSRSGEDGCLASWITNDDRTAYENYLQYTSVSSAMQAVGNLAADVYSCKGWYDDYKKFKKDMDLSEKANEKSIKDMQDLIDNSGENTENVINDLKKIHDLAMSNFSNNPQKSISALYDSCMDDGGLLGQFSYDEKEVAVKAVIATAGSSTIVSSSVEGMKILSIGDIVSGAAKIGITTYTNLFNYAAWNAMRYSYSGRMANRTWYYMSYNGWV